MSPILLIDLSSIFHARWHVSPQDALNRTCLAIAELSRRYRDLIVCCDHPTNWRHERTAHFPPERRYKGNRIPDPQLQAELIRAKCTLRRRGFAVVQCDGYEADDVIATLVRQAGSAREVRIMSEDKDLHQLVSQTCTQITKRGWVTPVDCERKFGVPPSKMRDLIALMGDSSDNIAGCAGIGKVTAANILIAFGSIEGAIAAGPVKIREVPGVGKTTAIHLMDWSMDLAVELVTLKVDCPIDLHSILVELKAS